MKPKNGESKCTILIYYPKNGKFKIKLPIAFYDIVY